MQRGRRKPGLCWDEGHPRLRRTLCAGFPGSFLLRWPNMVAAVGQLLKDPVLLPTAPAWSASAGSQHSVSAGIAPLPVLSSALPSSIQTSTPAGAQRCWGCLIDGPPPAQPVPRGPPLDSFGSPDLSPSFWAAPPPAKNARTLRLPPAAVTPARPLPLPTPWLGQQAPLLWLWQGHRLWLFLLVLPLSSSSWSFLPGLLPSLVPSDAHSPFSSLSLSCGPRLLSSPLMRPSRSPCDSLPQFSRDRERRALPVSGFWCIWQGWGQR